MSLRRAGVRAAKKNQLQELELEGLGELVEQGTIKPALDTVYPLDKPADALRHLTAGRTQGKLAVSIAAPDAPSPWICRARAVDVSLRAGSTLARMSPGIRVLSGLGGSAAEWRGAKRALGWRTELGDSLPPAGSVVVIGHSSGAVGALKLAVAHPDRVDAVVLTSGFFPPARGGRTIAATIADYVRHRASFVRDVALRRRTPRPTRRGGRELAELARLGIRPDRFHAVAANVRCRVLVIHGDADHVVPVAFARAAVTRHPPWAYHEIHGAGHHPHRDHPEAWARIVASWLEPPAAGTSSTT